MSEIWSQSAAIQGYQRATQILKHALAVFLKIILRISVSGASLSSYLPLFNQYSSVDVFISFREQGSRTLPRTWESGIGRRHQSQGKTMAASCSRSWNLNTSACLAFYMTLLLACILSTVIFCSSCNPACSKVHLFVQLWMSMLGQIVPLKGSFLHSVAPRWGQGLAEPFGCDI